MPETKNQNLKKLFAEFKFQEILDLLKEKKELTHDEIIFKANSHFELGNFDQALNLYENLHMYTNLGFCYLLKNDFQQAKAAYLKAEPSSAKKWGLFMVLLLSKCEKVFPGPGFLTFRLFFESSYHYFLKFNKSDFVARIDECVFQLKPLYPDLEKEIAKARSLI